MPASPTKLQRPVTFKVTVPTHLEKVTNYRSSVPKQKSVIKKRLDGFVNCNKSEQINHYSSTSDLNHQLKNIDLRYKIQNALHLDQMVHCSRNVIDSLRHSSYGQVVYNRNHVLSEVCNRN